MNTKSANYLPTICQRSVKDLSKIKQDQAKDRQAENLQAPLAETNHETRSSTNEGAGGVTPHGVFNK